MRRLSVSKSRLFTVAFLAAALLGCAGPSSAQEAAKESTYTPSAEPRPLDPVPDESEADRVKLDKNLDWLKAVEDAAPLRSADENPDEHNAYNYVLAHARRMDPAALARHSLRDLPFANLVEPIRQDYRSDLIRVEGRALSITPFKPTEMLAKADGFTGLYEVWLFPDERANDRNPICLIVSELPAGVETGPLLNYAIRADAYYFKLLKYKSREKVADGKYQSRVAPLFLGRSFSLAEAGDSTFTFGKMFVPAVIAVIVAVAGAGLAIGLYFRRGDRRVKEQLREAQSRINPFADAASGAV